MPPGRRLARRRHRLSEPTILEVDCSIASTSTSSLVAVHSSEEEDLEVERILETHNERPNDEHNLRRYENEQGREDNDGDYEEWINHVAEEDRFNDAIDRNGGDLVATSVSELSQNETLILGSVLILLVSLLFNELVARDNCGSRGTGMDAAWLLVVWSFIGGLCYLILFKTTPGGGGQQAEKKKTIEQDAAAQSSSSSSAADWLNVVLSWVAARTSQPPSFLSDACLRALNETARKIGSATTCEVLFEDFASGTSNDPPKIDNVTVEQGPREHLVITAITIRTTPSWDQTVRGRLTAPSARIRVVSSQRTPDKLVVSHWTAHVDDLVSEVEVRLAGVGHSGELAALVCLTGRPEMRVWLEHHHNNSGSSAAPDATPVEQLVRRSVLSSVAQFQFGSSSANGGRASQSPANRRNLAATMPTVVNGGDLTAANPSSNAAALSAMFKRLSTGGPQQLLSSRPGAVNVRVIRLAGVQTPHGIRKPFVVVEMDDPPAKHTSTPSSSGGANAAIDETFHFSLTPSSEEMLFEVYDDGVPSPHRKQGGQTPQFVGLALVSFDDLLRRSAASNNNPPSTLAVELPLQPRPYHPDDVVSGSLSVAFHFENGDASSPSGGWTGKHTEQVRVKHADGTEVRDTLSVERRRVDYDPQDDDLRGGALDPTTTSTVFVKGVVVSPKRRTSEKSIPVPDALQLQQQQQHHVAWSPHEPYAMSCSTTRSISRRSHEDVWSRQRGPLHVNVDGSTNSGDRNGLPDNRNGTEDEFGSPLLLHSPPPPQSQPGRGRDRQRRSRRAADLLDGIRQRLGGLRRGRSASRAGPLASAEPGGAARRSASADHGKKQLLQPELRVPALVGDGGHALLYDDDEELDERVDEAVSLPPSRDTSRTRWSASNNAGRHRSSRATAGAVIGDLDAISGSAISDESSRSMRVNSSLVLELPVAGSQTGRTRHYFVPPSVRNEPTTRRLLRRGRKLHVHNDHVFAAVRRTSLVQSGRSAIAGPGGAPNQPPIPVKCSVCGHRMGGGALSRSVYRCTDCQLTCHKNCHYKTQTLCALEASKRLNIACDVDWSKVMSRHQADAEYISDDGL